MPSQLVILDATDAAFADLFDLPDADGGIPSSSLAAKVVNQGDQEETEGFIRVLSSPDSSTAGLAFGDPAVDGGWIQIQVAGGGWQDCGAGLPVALPTLGVSEEVVIGIRTFAPADGLDHTPVIFLEVVAGSDAFVPATQLGSGPGVVLPIHDPTAAGFLSDPQLSAGSGAFDVDLSEWAWIAGGALQSIVAATETLTDVDGDSVTLGVGEEYAAGFYGGASGYEVVKGSLVAGTATADDLPATPSGTVLAGWASVDTTGVVTVTESLPLNFYRVRASTSLGIDVGDGLALVHNRSPLSRSIQSTTVTDDATSTVWLLPRGGLDVTDGSVPTGAPQAIPLADVTAAAGVVTGVVDRRRWAGVREASCSLGVVNGAGLAVNDLSDPVSVPEGEWQLIPMTGVAMFLDDAGNTPTAGQTVMDIERRPLDSTTWTTIYTSQTTSVPDRGPTVAWDSATLSTNDSLPEVLSIQGPCMIRAKVAEIPTATTTPGGARLVVRVVS